MIWQSRKKLASLFLVSGILTGFSRIYIGEHFLIDILGAGLAASIGFIVMLLVQRYLSEEVKQLAELGYKVQKKISSYLPTDI
jgi:PAP2 superfamily.